MLTSGALYFFSEGEAEGEPRKPHANTTLSRLRATHNIFAPQVDHASLYIPSHIRTF